MRGTNKGFFKGVVVSCGGIWGGGQRHMVGGEGGPPVGGACGVVKRGPVAGRGRVR
jgi:hypothetical protein